MAECLRPGLAIVLYDDELEGEAVAEYDAGDQSWWARPDHATYRDLSYR